MEQRLLDPVHRNELAKVQRRLRGGINVFWILIVVMLALNLILLHRIFFSAQGIAGFQNQNQQVREMENRIRQLREENQNLYNKIQALKTNPQSQERLVREELGWVRQNELIVEFPAPAKPLENRKSP